MRNGKSGQLKTTKGSVRRCIKLALLSATGLTKRGRAGRFLWRRKSKSWKRVLMRGHLHWKNACKKSLRVWVNCLSWGKCGGLFARPPGHQAISEQGEHAGGQLIITASFSSHRCCCQWISGFDLRHRLASLGAAQEPVRSHENFTTARPDICTMDEGTWQMQVPQGKSNWSTVLTLPL